jgi:hypothetical protein
MATELTKDVIVKLLRTWVNQRPGLDPSNYGFPAYSQEQYKQARQCYQSESRKITQQKHDADILLRAVELSGGLTVEDLKKAFSAFSGRLELKEESGEWRLEYCTGQYWPTEYRAAACAVLASALWNYHRPDYDNDDNAGDKIRTTFKRMFGRRIQESWF